MKLGQILGAGKGELYKAAEAAKRARKEEGRKKKRRAELESMGFKPLKEIK